MRTSKWLLYIAIGTSLCLMYVYQQIEIVKFGYKIDRAQKALEVCLDRKTSLEYIVSSLESPSNIDKSLLLKDNAYEMPATYKLVKLAPRVKEAGIFAKRALPSGSSKQSLRRLAFQTFFGSKQAEAKTIK
jgi:hypothetical protein